MRVCRCNACRKRGQSSNTPPNTSQLETITYSAGNIIIYPAYWNYVWYCNATEEQWSSYFPDKHRVFFPNGSIEIRPNT